MQISNNYYVSNVSISPKQKISNPQFKAAKNSVLLNTTVALMPLSAAAILTKPFLNTNLQLIHNPNDRQAENFEKYAKVLDDNVGTLLHIDTPEKNKYKTSIDRIIRKKDGGWSILEQACTKSKNPEVIEKLYELLGKDAFLAREAKDVMNPLELACAYNKNPEVIEKLYELLGKDAFINSEDKHNRSPLEIACVNNENPKVITTLCKLFGIGIFLRKRNPWIDSPRDLMIRYNTNPDTRKELDTIRALPKCKF